MNKKKISQLGIDAGTASNRLKKTIMFLLVKETGRDVCFQCKRTIEKVEDLSIEHIEPWLDSEDPAGLYFDINNIAFSHLSCNVKAARKNREGQKRHPSMTAYQKGCRCDGCKELKKQENKRNRKT